MLKENKEIFDLCNITQWQKDNLGEGTTIVLLDDNGLPFEYMEHLVEIPFPTEEGDGHMAGVGAVGHQVAPKAKIIFMPFNGAGITGRHQMVEWITDNKDRIDLINISLSFGRKGAIEPYLIALEKLCIPIICASGNDSEEDDVTYPAKFPYTIAVGAYNSNWEGQASYSNGGKELDCIAHPGTSYPSSSGKPIYQFGTSFASPFVAFSLALYISWRKRNNLPKLTTEEVRRFIKGNAKDLYEEGHDYKSGYGLFRLPSEIPIIGEEELMTNDYFKDDDGKWHEKFNNELAKLGILEGDGKGNFRPGDTVTRGELSKVAVLLRNNILNEVSKMIGGK